MNFLFAAVIVAVIGGAIWTLTRKKNVSNVSGGTIGGGGSLPEEPKGPINEA